MADVANDPKATTPKGEPPKPDPLAEKRAAKKAARAELKALRAKTTVQVRPGTSARNISQLNAKEIEDLRKQNKPVPGDLTPEESHRLWELHYLAAGQPVPVHEDVDD